MEKKQTAVQWLQSQYENSPESILTDDDFNKALQMEREQIIMSYHEGYSNAIQEKPKEYNPEQYYTQTFKP